MERRLNLASLMGLALLLLATTAAAANSGSGSKFCYSYSESNGILDEYIYLSQRPSSYEPNPAPYDNENFTEYFEYCSDTWLEFTESWADLVQQLESRWSGVSLYLESDLDFGGVSTDSLGCNENFKPLTVSSSYASYFNGGGYTIKNLCYVVGSSNQEGQAGTTRLSSVGFFSELTDGKVENLNFENVFIKVNNDGSYSSVPTGVVVGLVGENGAEFNKISLKNAKIIAAQAGGVVGVSYGETDFKNILGENVEVVAANGVVPANLNGNMAGSMSIDLGGLVGSASRNLNIANVGFSDLNVHSDIWSVTVEGANGYLDVNVGGLVGSYASSSDNESAVVNTYTTGSVTAPEGCENGTGGATDGGKKCNVGFLFGNVSFDSYLYAGYNYHYGATDYQAENVAGRLYQSGSDVTTYWINGSGSQGGSHPLGGGLNYRNSISGKVEPTNCNQNNPVYMGPSYGYRCLLLDGSNYGGYVEPEAMKADAFAVWLNGVSDAINVPSSDGGYQKWSRKNGLNNGLPVFATDELKPIYQIDFMAGSDYYENISATEKQKWIAAGASETADGLSLSVYTDYTGKLSNSTWQTTAAQIVSNSYYWSYFDEQTSKIVAFPIKTSTTFNSSMTLSLSEKITVTVRHGFVESTDGDEFYTLDEYSSFLGEDVYFMGTPAATISSDSAWTRVPYLASYDEDEGVYKYYGFRLTRKSCENYGDDDEPDIYCYYNTVNMNGSNGFYTDALSEFSNGDTLYVVYESEPMNTAGGYLFVGDLHGSRFDLGVAKAQMKAVDANGESLLFGAPDYLEIETSTSSAIESILRNAFNDQYTSTKSMPFSPYLVADYPPDFWNNVNGTLALVIVGASSNDGATELYTLMGSALSQLASNNLDHPFLKDTVKALESPVEIRAKMDDQVKSGNNLVYARYVWLDKDGGVDLTNLFAAVEYLRQYEYDYPIYVGFLPQTAEIRYHVTFDVNYETNTDYNPLFIAAAWNGKTELSATYTAENQYDQFFRSSQWHAFRTDACFVGEFSPDLYSDGIYMSNFGMVEELLSNEEEQRIPYTTNKDGSKSMKLYAQWEYDVASCSDYAGYRIRQGQESVWNNYVVKDNSELGNIVLQQVWMGDTLRHMSMSQDAGVTGILVPYADTNHFVFEVFADGYPGYELDGDILFSVQGQYEDEPTVTRFKEGDLLTIDSWDLMSSNMEFSANYTYKKFNIVFESGKTDVLYGENSDSVGVYKLKSKNDAIDLPKWVYTEDNCVDGWMWHPESVDKDPYLADFDGDGVRPVQEENVHDNWTTVFDEFNFALSEELDNQLGNRLKEYPLYAVWVDAKTCVKDLGYKQARLNIAENGLVKFKELVRDSDGKVLRTQVHQFAKDSTMLLPSYVDGANFVVLGAPAKGYILDSLVMILNGDTSVYHEGDTLAGDIAKATFEVYFMLDNTTPAEFVKAELLQSGSAIRFEFVTSEFGVSGASVKIVLEDDDGKAVADTVLAVPATPYADSWEYFPLRAGTYLLTATVKNSKSSDVFEKDFEVKSTIASKKDGWQMLSLSNVIMDSVTWDDDVRFFWWDDARDYGAYWRYQRLTKKDKVDDLTGYWYSSLEGRPLVMRKDMKPPKSPVVWDLDSVYTGWNLVANPYGWYVDLYGENQEQKKSSIEKSDIEFWSWNDSLSAYEEVDVVGPYEAVWAKVKAPGKWKLPSKPDFVATVDENGNDSLTKPLKKTVELASNRRGNWAIRAVLRDAKGKRDGWNIMGVSESGWSAEEPPAGMGDHVNLSIKDGNRSLAKSFKAASGDSYEWTVSLDASGNRTGYLHFEGLEAVREAGLKVFVTVDGTTTQMAENDTLKVAIGSMAKTATVRVAPSARTIVAQKLNGLRAFQSGNALQVGFQVSESLEGAKAYVEILDMKGKVLSSVSGTAVSGSNSMTLQAPKSGLYMIRVRVGSKQAAGSIAVK
ncbi:MAG: T9SS type A sorting domain-containing protein [Fibrobacter sp.]|nr:T9SS type A sorting domain-containing protein [Fibrobacter sp.]